MYTRGQTQGVEREWKTSLICDVRPCGLAGVPMFQNVAPWYHIPQDYLPSPCLRILNLKTDTYARTVPTNTHKYIEISVYTPLTPTCFG